jgi:hypothetical protein
MFTYNDFILKCYVLVLQFHYNEYTCAQQNIITLRFDCRNDNTKGIK